jgi:hypothetical protein
LKFQNIVSTLQFSLLYKILVFYVLGLDSCVVTSELVF